MPPILPSDPSLPDRTRMAPSVSDPTSPAFVPGVQVIDKLRVNELYIGDGIRIEWRQGTVFKNGRLRISGVGANSVEIERVPGPLCKGPVMAQDLWFASDEPTGFLRRALSWVREKASVPGDPRGYIDKWVDSGIDASGTRPLDHTEIQTGGRTRADGSDDGGRLLRMEYPDGQIDQVEPNGSRKTLRNPGGIPADPR